MEKLGSEIATLFTHSHVVSLVVSFQPLSFPLSSTLLGSGGVIVPFAAAGACSSGLGWRPRSSLFVLNTISSPLTLQSAAACLLGQLGQQGVTFDLQPMEWIPAATHALCAPAEVRSAR